MFFNTYTQMKYVYVLFIYLPYIQKNLISIPYINNSYIETHKYTCIFFCLVAMFLHPLNLEITGNRILELFFLNILYVEGKNRIEDTYLFNFKL